MNKVRNGTLHYNQAKQLIVRVDNQDNHCVYLSVIGRPRLSEYADIDHALSAISWGAFELLELSQL